MDLEQGLQLSSLIDMLKRRIGVILGCTGAVLLLAIFVAAILPNEFRSSATLLVEPQEINERLIESGLPERGINSRLHIIQMQIMSRARLSKVIEELELYADESKTMTRQDVISMMRDQITLQPILPELEEGLSTRRRDIEINTFQLGFSHPSAKTAAAVANRLANDFINQHIRERISLTSGTTEFIELKLTQLSERTGVVEARIAEIKTENAGQLPDDLHANQRLQERILDGVRIVRREFALAKSDEAFYRQQVATGVSDFYRYRNDASPEQRLDILRLSRRQMESRGFTEKHPDVIANAAEMSELELSIANSADSEGGEGLSVAQQNAQAEAQRAGLRGASANEDLQVLRGQLEEVERKIAATPRVAEQLSSLEREWSHLSGSYQEFSDKRLEAGVAGDVERRQKGERFRVLEAAYPEPKASSPNRPVIIALGFFVGFFLGVGIAILLEAGDTSFHAAGSLQDRLRIPVLASIPEVRLASDLVAARRRRVRQLLGAGAIAACVLVASFVGNRVVNSSSQPDTASAEARE